VRSRVPYEAILRAAPTGDAPAVVAENVTGARITGFRILADAAMPLAAGIVLVNSVAEVDEVEVSGAGVGIEVRGGARVALRGSSIHDCAGVGVLISGPSAPWISHNIVRGNKVGLAVRDGARPALADNLFEKNKTGLELPPEMPLADVRLRNLILDASPTRTAPAVRPRQPAGKSEPAPEGKQQ
jgi:hypothetical protein